MALFKSSITLADVSDGAPGLPGAPGKNAEAYEISFNKTELLKYRIKNIESQNYTTVFKPSSLDFRVIKKDLTIGQEVILWEDGINYDISFGFQDNLENFISLSNSALFEQLGEYLTYAADTGLWSLNITKIVEYIFQDGSESISSLFNILYQGILSDTNIFLFNLIINEITVGVFPVFINWASTAELAEFSSAADGITMAVDNSKLEFSADGLTINNNGIKILIDNESVFQVRTSESGDTFLEVHGNIYANDGYFKGHIEAESGTFNGIVNATGGTFEGTVKATDGYFKGEIEATNSSFKGYIEADSGIFKGTINATSGTLDKVYIGSVENDYILISASEGIVQRHVVERDENNIPTIRESNFSLKPNGEIRAKNIILESGTIGGMTFKNGEIKSSSWAITPETATFNNIVASGKITTAIFEKQNIQLCGGTFIFKESFFISPFNGLKQEVETASESEDFLTITNSLDNPFVLNSNNVYLFTTANRQYRFFAKVTNSIIANGITTYTFDIQKKDIPFISGSELYNILINLGTEVDGIIQDWVIGINSSAENMSSIGLAEKSVTLSSIEKDSNGYSFKQRVVLGYLPGNLIQSEEDSYGLYADSVYLTGSLTTKITEGKYAGINTNTKDETGENIVIWGGASKPTDIATAPFRVTSSGVLYAREGVFEGAILTDSTITASEIKTAIITGTNTNDAALLIKDADTGIKFISEDGENIKDIFVVRTDKIEINNELYLNNTNSNFNIYQAAISGKHFLFNNPDDKKEDLFIDATGLHFCSDYSTNEKFKNRIYFNDDSFNFDINNFTQILIGSSKTEIQNDLVLTQGYQIKGENGKIKMDYQKVYIEDELIGMDIFIYE